MSATVIDDPKNGLGQIEAWLMAILKALGEIPACFPDGLDPELWPEIWTELWTALGNAIGDAIDDAIADAIAAGAGAELPPVWPGILPDISLGVLAKAQPAELPAQESGGFMAMPGLALAAIHEVSTEVGTLAQALLPPPYIVADIVADFVADFGILAASVVDPVAKSLVTILPRLDQLAGGKPNLGGPTCELSKDPTGGSFVPVALADWLNTAGNAVLDVAANLPGFTSKTLAVSAADAVNPPLAAGSAPGRVENRTDMGGVTFNIQSQDPAEASREVGFELRRMIAAGNSGNGF